MRKAYKSRHGRSEDGVALLIAIFVLLLVSVVAIALLVSSGTETALGANYRSSTGVYYAALAGLEEARGRLLPKSPNYFNKTTPGFMPAVGTTLPLDQVRYVTNPLGAENVLTTYPDTEYDQEFNPAHTLAGATVQTIASISGNNTQGIPGPFYKWVRINAVTEWSLKIDVNQDSTFDSTTPLYYDGTHLNLTSTGVQALGITALAVLPNGSQKIVQYVVAPVAVNVTFPAALTLDGNGVQYAGPGTTQFYIEGNDQNPSSNPPPNGCTPTSTVNPAIGYTNSSDASGIESGENPAPNYQGQGGSPSMGLVSLSSSLQSLTALDNLVQTLTLNADVVLNGPATGSNMPTGMSASNPMTIVVNGDLDLNAWHSTGYGVLLVTGEFKYDPDVYWNGIIFVIGKGKLTLENNGLGTIYGAVFIAKTVDATTGLPLVPPAPLGAASVAYASGNGGVGIYYSSCWVNYVQGLAAYKVLSFREISQ
jgi:hypothetical protein